MRENNMIRFSERTLYVELSDKEKQEQASVLVSQLDELDMIETEKKIANEEFKKKSSQKEDEIKMTKTMIKHGVMQEVTVTEYLSEDLKEVYVVRNDTGKEIERRPASEADRQTVII